MAAKVSLSGDGSSIKFSVSEQPPTTLRKFRQSQEIEGLYRFIFENDLQKEALEIIDRLVGQRKLVKNQAKEDARAAKAAAKAELKAAQKTVKAAAAKPAPKAAAKAPVKPAKKAKKK